MHTSFCVSICIFCVFTFRYHKLLRRLVPENLALCYPRGANISPGGQEFPPGATPILHYVYQCLFSPGVSGRVTGIVMEMTLDLLDGGGEGGEEGEGGVELVMSHVLALLAYLGGRVKAKGDRSAEGEGGNLQLEFNVLSRYNIE